jgi:hypothetical protein
LDPTGPPGRYRAAFAQAIVFFRSIATVTGPTPPGTGVIA